MAIFGYGRVSTAEQTTDNQRLEIERAGYLVEYWYADIVSGKAMVDAYEKKASISSLARLYGISRATVLKVVKHSPDLVLGKS